MLHTRTNKGLSLASYPQSVANTLNIGVEPKCGSLLNENDCKVIRECSKGMDSDDSGPAGMLIWNHFMRIYQIYSSYHNTLFKATSTVSTMLKDLENKFAPIPPNLDHIQDLFFINLLALLAAGPFFNSLIIKMSYFTGAISLLKLSNECERRAVPGHDPTHVSLR
jgi:hypothetical protein